VIAAFAWSQSSAATDRKVLPAPQRDGGPALASVLARRRSTRVFSLRHLEDAELGQLLWASASDAERAIVQSAWRGRASAVTRRARDKNLAVDLRAFGRCSGASLSRLIRELLQPAREPDAIACRRRER
jgi:hypothetical protein